MLFGPLSMNQVEKQRVLFGFGRSFGWKLNTRQLYQLQDGKSVTTCITLANKLLEYHVLLEKRISLSFVDKSLWLFCLDDDGFSGFLKRELGMAKAIIKTAN